MAIDQAHEQSNAVVKGDGGKKDSAVQDVTISAFDRAVVQPQSRNRSPRSLRQAISI
jgi:hypothetical protein